VTSHRILYIYFQIGIIKKYSSCKCSRIQMRKDFYSKEKSLRCPNRLAKSRISPNDIFTTKFSRKNLVLRKCSRKLSFLAEVFAKIFVFAKVFANNIRFCESFHENFRYFRKLFSRKAKTNFREIFVSTLP
jgi:hypothetical protein